NRSAWVITRSSRYPRRQRTSDTSRAQRAQAVDRLLNARACSDDEHAMKTDLWLLIRWSFFRLLVAYIIVISMILAVKLSYGQHGHWIDGYKNSMGNSCCGRRDCQIVHARMLEQDAQTATVEVNGVVIHMPVRSVHVSEDENDWFCTNYIEEKIAEK